MVKSLKNKGWRALIDLLLISVCLILPFCSLAAAPERSTKLLGNEILMCLVKQVPCKKMEVQIRPSKDKPGEIKILAVRMEGVAMGNMVADYMTVVYEKPVIDLNQLRIVKKFKILSSSKMKVSILISGKAFEEYVSGQARQFQNKNYRISIRLSPPCMECLFHVPVSGLSRKSLTLLDQFEKETQGMGLKRLMKSGKLEGYAAFQVKAKNNALSALPAKVIVNHFVIPDVVLRQLQNRVNPFDRLPVLAPFQYSINKADVQNKYLFLSN